jgi:tetratricopeptide (TPR) repeat protein
MAMTSASHSHRLKLLQAYAEIDQGMLAASSTTLSYCSEDDHETILASATLDFREGRYVKAKETYEIARQVVGSDQPMLTYYIALCHYQLSDYDASLELIEEFIDDSKGKDQEQCINEPFLVEAINLKGAILYMTKHADAAKNAMTQFKENLDAVTIHNDAIINIAEDPSIGIQKLEFLLSKQPFPPETLSNLLTLYTSHGQDHLSAEAFETNKCLAKELLPPDLYAYFDAVMMSISCPDDAFFLIEAVSIPIWNIYAVTQHLLTRRNFLFLNSLRGFWRSLVQRSHSFFFSSSAKLNDLITNQSMPFPFAFAMLNALQPAATQTHSLSDPTVNKLTVYQTHDSKDTI